MNQPGLWVQNQCGIPQGNEDPSTGYPHTTGYSYRGKPLESWESEHDFRLNVVQHPENGRVALGKEKDRKPLDPPPFIQLEVSRKKDPHQAYLQSPYYFMSCAILKNEPNDDEPKPNALMGSLVSSLHRLKNNRNGDSAYFIFGDLSVRYEGKFKLLFNLYQMTGNECIFLTSITSKPFEVFPAKSFPGLMESTWLTRSFSDQGVRLRIRKDSRSMTTRKRNQSVANFAQQVHEGQSGSNARSDHGHLSMRSNGVEDGSSQFGSQSPSFYGPQGGMVQHSSLKRKRPEDDNGVNSLDMSGYPQRHGHHPGLYPLQIPQMPTTTTGYSMQSPATAPPVPFVGGHLGRIDTSNQGRPPAPLSTPNSAHPFQSPQLRHSPHSAYNPYAMQSALSYSSAPSQAPMHSLSPHVGDYRSVPGSMFSPHAGVENSPRNHTAQHAVNPNASSSTSPSEANYTPAPPQEPYTPLPGAYTYPGQNLGVGAPSSMADPRNATILNMEFHDQGRATHPYDSTDSAHNDYQSNGATPTTAYGSAMSAASAYPSGPSTAASTYHDGERGGNSYQDHDKGNDTQQ